MKSLAKLVALNQPDLVLFVGEALVGNDGLNQLVEFNKVPRPATDASHPARCSYIPWLLPQTYLLLLFLLLLPQSLVDFSPDGQNPRRIDGIILTKFDTIDDKVGATISMVHKTGQPIVFVGTGQKYTNLKRLNVSKVVRALCT